MYTHIMIEDAIPAVSGNLPLLKKGDYTTLEYTIFEKMKWGKMHLFYIFKEDKRSEYGERAAYSHELFVPIPPQKTEYVAVPEKIMEPELV